MSMETRQDDNDDGSNIFWPGYVDATTNLILNLLFLLTILIVAVFMFALELGRTSKVHVENPPPVATKPAEQNFTKPVTDIDEEATEPARPGHGGVIQAPVPSLDEQGKVPSLTTLDLQKENDLLKREIENLKKALALKTRAGGISKPADGTSALPVPQSGIDKTIRNNMEIVVRFKDEAIMLTDEEKKNLMESLKPVMESGKAIIYVEVPAGFSETKRMGYYRAMSVRNVMIEMNMQKENIEVSVIEGKGNANASIVKVRTQ